MRDIPKGERIVRFRLQVEGATSMAWLRNDKGLAD